MKFHKSKSRFNQIWILKKDNLDMDLKSEQFHKAKWKIKKKKKRNLNWQELVHQMVKQDKVQDHL